MGNEMQAPSFERLQTSQRDSLATAMKSPRDVDRKYDEFSRHQDEGYYSLSGPGISAMSQQSVFTFFHDLALHEFRSQ